MVPLPEFPFQNFTYSLYCCVVIYIFLYAHAMWGYGCVRHLKVFIISRIYSSTCQIHVVLILVYRCTLQCYLCFCFPANVWPPAVVETASDSRRPPMCLQVCMYYWSFIQALNFNFNYFRFDENWCVGCRTSLVKKLKGITSRRLEVKCVPQSLFFQLNRPFIRSCLTCIIL